MNNYKDYLGWGWVGTPKGRQQLDGGTNQHFQIQFDLEQTLGGCLPEPDEADLTKPLYMLSHHNYEGDSILGLATYLPISEMSGYRSGNFLGAFITSCNSQPQEPKKWLDELQTLCFAQYKTLVNHGSRTYNQSLTEANLAEVNELNLAELLPNWLEISHKIDALYIHMNKGQIVDVLTALLKLGLFYRYSRIYFSENEVILQKVRGKNIEQINADQIIGGALFNQPYHTALLQYNQTCHQLKQELEQTQSYQATLVEQQVSVKAQSYIDEMYRAQQEADKLKQDLHQANILATIGEAVVRAVGDRAAQLNNEALQRFATPPKPAFSTELSAIQTQLNGIHQRLAHQNVVSEENEDSSRGYQWLAAIFGGLAIAFLGTTIWFSVFSSVSEQEIKDSPTYQRLNTELSQAY